MTQSNLTAAQRLQQIQNEVAQWNASAKRRRTIGTIVLIILVVGTAAYLGFAYARFSDVRPAEVIALAEDQLQPVLNVSEEDLSKQFQSAAPSVIAKVESSVLEMPAMIERRFYEHLDTQMDAQLPELEQQLSANFKESLKTAREHAIASGRNVDDPKKVQALMSEIAVLLRQEMQKVVENFHNDYASQASDLTHYLTLLAEGQNLDQRQQIQRDVLIHFFALMDKYQQADGTPALAPG